MSGAPERVILRVLQESSRSLSRPITRTELVKLVYLVDYFYAQHMNGQTLSGLEYFWDNYGPNATGNSIVKRAEVLDSDGSIVIDESLTSFGNLKIEYRANENAPTSTLGAEADALIAEIVKTYGPLGWKDLKKYSYGTKPMQGIQKGDMLDLRPGPVLREVTAIFSARMKDGAYDNPGPRVSLAELKQRASSSR